MCSNLERAANSEGVVPGDRRSGGRRDHRHADRRSVRDDDGELRRGHADDHAQQWHLDDDQRRTRRSRSPAISPNANDAYSHYAVESVLGAVITLSCRDALTTQSNIPNITVRPVALNPTFERRGGTDGLDVTITDNGFNSLGRVGDTITRRRASWIADGFVKGALLKISGSRLNATDAFTSYTVTDVTATTLTLSARDILATQTGDPRHQLGLPPRDDTRLIIDQTDDLDVTVFGKLHVTATGNVQIGSQQSLKLGVIDTPGRTSLKTPRRSSAPTAPEAPGPPAARRQHRPTSTSAPAT